MFMFKRLIRDLKKYYHYSMVSAKAQLKAEVANSFLNWIWWILDPFCMMMVYVFVFGYVFDAREPQFGIFVFTGLTMWTFFNRTLTNSVKIVKRNKSLVSKVYFPKYILILTEIWINGFKMIVSLAVIVVMMIAFKVSVGWNLIFVVPIFVIFGIVTFGISCLLLHFGVYVEDLSNVIKIILRLMMYLSGIFYDVQARIPEYGELLCNANPAAFLIASMRQSLIYKQTPNLGILLLWLLIGLFVSLAGVAIIYKEENSYVKSI